MSLYEDVKQSLDIPSFNDAVKSIVVRPQDVGGIGGYYFDMAYDDTLNLESETTDYVIENNSPIQDNIALKPIKITVSGLVSEVGDINSIRTLLDSTVPTKLMPMTGLAPKFYNQMTNALSKAQQFDAELKSTLDQAENLYNKYNKDGETIDNNQTKQQIAYAFFYGAWKSRQLMTVETPWAVFSNCAIEKVNLNQDRTSKYKSTISIDFKVMTFAQTMTTKAFGGTLTGRANGQASSEVNNGKTTGTQKPIRDSFLSRIIN